MTDIDTWAATPAADLAAIRDSLDTIKILTVYRRPDIEYRLDAEGYAPRQTGEDEALAEVLGGRR